MALQKRIFGILAVAAIALLLVIGLAWFLVHTTWFSHLLRARLVATMEAATGGRVELGEFRFHPDTLQADLDRLIIHGKEPPGSLPFLSIGRAVVGLKFLSLRQQRKMDIASIMVDRPQLHLLVNPDGTTNAPVPQVDSGPPLDQFLDLKVGRVQINHGLAAINDRQIPFALTARDLSLVLTYDPPQSDYRVAINAAQVNGQLLSANLPLAKLTAITRLNRNGLAIEAFDLETEKRSSTVRLTGRVDHFEQPVAHINVDSMLSVDEIARLAGIHKSLRGGSVVMQGIADFSAAGNQFTFNGNAEARDVAFVSPQFTLRGIGLLTNVVVTNAGVRLERARASAQGARFAGRAVAQNFRQLQVQGEVSNVGLNRVGAYLTRRPFPWSGEAHGEAHASATLGAAHPNLIIGASLDILPGSSGVPTSGHVGIDYANETGHVEFNNSTLNLPHTTAHLHGALESDLWLDVQSSDLNDLQPLGPILAASISAAELPAVQPAGFISFAGELKQITRSLVIQGELKGKDFRYRDESFASLHSQVSLAADHLTASQFQVSLPGANLNGSFGIQLANWAHSADSPLSLNVRLVNLDVVKALSLVSRGRSPIVHGSASGTVTLQGSLNHPRGDALLGLVNVDALGERFNQAKLDAVFDSDRIQLRNGTLRSGSATLAVSGDYHRGQAGWSTGELQFKADSNEFRLSSLEHFQRWRPDLDGRAELHLEASGQLKPSSFEPSHVNGVARISHVTLNNRLLGNVAFSAATQGTAIDFLYNGDLRDIKFQGAAQARLTQGTPIRGQLDVGRISLAAAQALTSNVRLALPFDGFLEGHLAFDGPLQEPLRLHARVTVNHFEVNSLPRSGNSAGASIPEISLANREPILLDVSNGTLNISQLEIDGRDTRVRVSGSLPLVGNRPMDVSAVGTANLGLYMLVDPNARSSGSTELSTRVTGTFAAPALSGTLRVRRGSFFFADIPNGLSDVDGNVLFNQNRATIQRMTAHSGGGDISLGGSISYGAGSPLAYHLEAAARNVRVRYANSISVTANSDLRLSGNTASSLLSGTLTISRVVLTQNADAGNLLAAASTNSAPTAKPDDLLAGLHLDVQVESAPNLQVGTDLSRDVEAEIQLRVRGTPSHPIVLGSITANQGDIKLFGSQFSLNRGEVSFINPIRVEPIFDLDLETQARGVTVDITVSGTINKLNFNYRSDPPLQPRDIIALLTVGRAPNVAATTNAQGASDVSALTSGVNSVLGSAISPVSNRLSKLFGVANIRIDPFVQGITNTPQARLSVEQQISRNVTITYITNLSQTSEQIFRFEWALSRQFSVVAIRDDNGEFGLDFQYKKRFK